MLGADPALTTRGGRRGVRCLDPQRFGCRGGARSPDPHATMDLRVTGVQIGPGIPASRLRTAPNDCQTRGKNVPPCLTLFSPSPYRFSPA